MHEKQPNTNAPKKNLLSVPPLATVQNKLTEMIPTAKRAAMTALATGMVMAGATGCSSQVQAQNDTGVYVGRLQINPDGTAEQSRPENSARTHFFSVRTGISRVNNAFGPDGPRAGGDMTPSDIIFLYPHLEPYVRQFVGEHYDHDHSLNAFTTRDSYLWDNGYDAYMARLARAESDPTLNVGGRRALPDDHHFMPR